ncbi:hypothetical protein HMI55_003488 [Coelomomyces lativittatus]|nr:hypothetical protein HMI55_003488 [Coelomomyces lativittatus]
MTLLDKPQIIPYIAQSLQYTPHDVKWIPGTPKFVVLGENSKGLGVLQVYTLQQGKLEKLTEAEVASPFKCSSFGASSRGASRQLATGNFAGTLSVYDPEHFSVPIYESKAHSSIINCIDACGGNTNDYGPPEIVTGSRDGNVKVWDIRQRDTPVATFSPDPNGKVMDCWSVAFGNSYNDKDRYVQFNSIAGTFKLIKL